MAAPNTVTNWTPQIWAQALGPLRQNAITPRLVRNFSSTETAQQGNVINVPKSVAATARAITPAITPAANQTITAAQAVCTLDKWYEATLPIGDSEYADINRGVLPEQYQECFKVLANQIDADVLRYMYAFGGGVVGTPGTTPFGAASSLTVATTAMRRLNQQLAPQDARFALLDPIAHAAMVATPDAMRFDGAGPALAQIDGVIGRRFGIDWAMNQNISTLTAGTTAWCTGWTVATAAAAAGATSMTIINSTASGTINAGTLFQVSASLVHAVVATAEATATTNLTINFYPSLAAALASGADITVVASYTPNIVCQREAVGFASRVAGAALGADEDSSTVLDPVTRVAIKMGITREYYQSTFRVSCLYGVVMLRALNVVRLAG